MNQPCYSLFVADDCLRKETWCFANKAKQSLASGVVGIRGHNADEDPPKNGLQAMGLSPS